MASHAVFTVQLSLVATVHWYEQNRCPIKHVLCMSSAGVRDNPTITSEEKLYLL
jgi:hypothetical protein